MKKLHVNRKQLLQAIYLACLAAFLGSSAKADIIASDDFSSYTPGVTQANTSTFPTTPNFTDSNFTNGGTGFSNPWTMGSLSGYGVLSDFGDLRLTYPNMNYAVNAGPLSYPGLATSGNTLTATTSAAPGTGNNGAVFGRTLSTPLAFGATPGNTYYLSALIQPNAPLGLGAFGGIFELQLSGSGSYFPLTTDIGGGGAAGNYTLGTKSGYPVQSAGGTSTVAEVAGTPVLMVEELQFADPSHVTVSLFLDPTAGAAQPLTADLTTGLINAPTTLSSLTIVNTGNFSMSDLQIATTWAEATAAVPEPSDYALMALGGAALLGLARRRKNATP